MLSVAAVAHNFKKQRLEREDSKTLERVSCFDSACAQKKLHCKVHNRISLIS